MTTALVASVPCCCTAPLPPCQGCSGTYTNPASAISVLYTHKINFQIAPQSLSFAPTYSPYQPATQTLCRWIDPTTKTSPQIPNPGGGYFVITMKGLVVLRAIAPQPLVYQMVSPGVEPFEWFWTLYTSDGTFVQSGAVPSIGKVICSADPFGNYGAMAGSSWSFGVVT